MGAPGSAIAVTNQDWQNLIGIQYALRGMDKETGLNCYGLVREVYKLLSIELPARDENALTADLVKTEGKNWIRIPGPVPYCVALMRRHDGNFGLGVITLDGKLLQCMPSTGVVLSRLSRYERTIVGYYKHKPGGGQVLPDAEDGDIARSIGQLLVTAGAIALTAAGYPYAGMALMAAGSLVVNALFPVQKPETPALSGVSGDLSDSRQYTWDGIVNESRQGLVKPLIFGRILVGGQIISEKTWFNDDGEEQLDVLICPAKNRITRVQTVYINDSEAEFFPGVTITTREGDDEQTLIEAFKKIYTQYKSGAKIPFDASTDSPLNKVTFSSKSKVTGCRFVVTAPRGIYELVGGTPIARNVTFKIQYKTRAEATWHPLNSDYAWSAGSIFSSTLFFSGRILQGFDTNTEVNGIKFPLTSKGTVALSEQTSGSLTIGRIYEIITYASGDDFTNVGGANASGSVFVATGTDPAVWTNGSELHQCGYINWSKYKVWYRKLTEQDWTLHGEYEAGANNTNARADGAWDIELENLDPAKYQVRIDWVNDINSDPLIYTDVTKCFTIGSVQTAQATSDLVIEGDADTPNSSVSKTVEIENLDDDYHMFRLWRTTIDQVSVYWQDDIYLNTYSEIIDAVCAYQNHPLIGVEAIASDRLSGSRPTIKSLVIGEPLSVPEASKRFDTTVYADEGAGDDNTRQIVVNAVLPACDGLYCWLVRMDSAGYAQVDRQLTKFTLRVVSWEDAGNGKTRLTINSTEAIPAGTEVMVFHENDMPYRNLAWAVTKMMILGSSGRITEEKIEWESFADWDAWNEELVWNEEKQEYEKRHLFDACIDWSSDLWSIAQRAAKTGRGVIIPSNGKYKIVVDRAGTHTQVFSEGNTRDVTVHPIPRQDRANIVLTSFLNEDVNYEEKYVSEPDVQGTEKPIIATIETLIGVTRESQARRYLKYVLKQNRYVENSVDFSAAFDAIESEVGDPIKLQSQLNIYAVGGRIKAVNDGSVTLDRSIAAAGETYELVVWCKDGSHTWQGVLTGEINEVPTTDQLPPAKPYEYTYILSRVGEETTKYRVLNTKYAAKTFGSQLSALEYHDEVYADD